jgi:hypothetical protein
MPKEPNDDHKNNLKEEILQTITENFMEMLLDLVNQNVQRHPGNFKTPKIKNLRRHKQINELIGALIDTKVKQRTL